MLCRCHGGCLLIRSMHGSYNPAEYVNGQMREAKVLLRGSSVGVPSRTGRGLPELELGAA